MKTSSPTIRRSAGVLLTTVSATALYACGGGGGGGSDPSPNAQAVQLKSDSNAMPNPPAFVPLATPLSADATEYDKHMQIARISWANNNDITAPYWCANPGQGSNPLLRDRTVVPITELFDGFYFVGTISVGQYVMKTPDGGYVLFDTMNNATDVRDITVPQLQAAGIEPSKLSGIVVTHGHGDHDGGVAELQARYHPATTVVGSADYSASKPYSATVAVDSTNLAPIPLTVAGATFTAMATPGHTPGTTSFILPVTYQGKQHKIAYLGGSAFPGTAAAALQYLRSAEAMYGQVKEQGADASINSHSFEDKSIDRIHAIQAQGGIASSNPMIQGTAKIQLGFATLRSCSAAQLYNRDATAINPVWRPTRTELYAALSNGNDGTTHVRARVSDYFSPISGGTVTFKTAAGDSCVAATDEEGIANCVIRSSAKGAGPAVVTAEFSELARADAVELSSFDTRQAQ
ncbi:MAG: MBL fold metallo-hydrolase [Variovorax sp.]|nr:MBL fold metallo-hydrolase [Variovorax sp.]